MLVWLGPLIGTVFVFFMNISVWNRGKLWDSLATAVVCLIGFAFLFCAILPFIFTSDHYNDQKFIKPVDGKVTVTVQGNGATYYQFKSDGKNIILNDHDDDVVLLPPTDGQKSTYGKFCQDVIYDIISSYSVGKCEIHLTANSVG